MAQGDPGITWWNFYVTTKANDVLYLTNPNGPGYDPVFTANLAWCYQNHAYGFGEYDPAVHPGAGDNRAHWWGVPGGIWNGPQKS
jgi:hypothetical protein